MTMINPALEDIKKYAERKLVERYQYCGVAESPEFAILNSGDDNVAIKITIKVEKEEQ